VVDHHQPLSSRYLMMIFVLFYYYFFVTTVATADNPISRVPISNQNMDFSNWDYVLQQCVNVNDKLDDISVHTFDYVRLTNDQTVKSHFDAFSDQVTNADTSGFGQSEFLAFWINVYNYLAVSTVLEHPCQKDLFGDCRPLTSILQVGQQQPSLLDTIWDMPQLTIISIGTLSLNNIEVDRLRKPESNPSGKEDVRIHACMVSASISCPNLRPRAYTVANISAEMDENTSNFLYNPGKGTVLDGNTVKVSEIFDWFKPDFESGNKTSNSISVRQFIADYTRGSDVAAALLKNAPTAFLTYNWNVNGNIGQLCNKNRACFPWWALLCLLLGLLIAVIVTAICVRRRMRQPYIPIAGPGLN